MPIGHPKGYDPDDFNPVLSYSIPWAETPESAATREATTALVDATIPAMKAALQAAFDREVTIARHPRATFVNHTDDEPCILDPDRTLT